MGGVIVAVLVAIFFSCLVYCEIKECKKIAKERDDAHAKMCDEIMRVDLRNELHGPMDNVNFQNALKFGRR